MWVKRWVMEDSYGATYNSLTFYCPVKINAVEVSSRVGSKILYTLKGLTRIQHRHFSKGHRWCMYMYTTYEECVSKCEDLNKSFNWDSIQHDYDVLNQYILGLKLHYQHCQYIYKENNENKQTP